MGLFTSESESFCLSILEAMSFGCPSVSTRVGGIPEVIQDDISGILVPMGDVEARAGAIFLDRGWDRVRAWLLALAAPELEADAPAGTLKSPKNRLQELTQRSGERPEYRVVQSSGPDHARELVIEVAVGGEVVGTGTGSSLRAAQTAAAEAGLDALGRRGARGPAASADPPEHAGS